jgi:HlyD family secretion protein
VKKLILLLLLLVLASAGYAGWRYYQNLGPSYVFRTVQAQRGTLTATISATGTLEPEEVIDVGAQVAGQIKAFGTDPNDSSKTIDYGSQVDVGTVLARLDDAQFQARVSKAQANLEHARVEVTQANTRLQQAKREWERLRGLLRSGSVAREDYEQARTEAETSHADLLVAQAAVRQAEAVLKEEQTNLQYTEIKSPVRGVIIDRRVNVGQTVVANLNAPSLFLIARDLKRMEIWASVNEADVGLIHPGQRVDFSVSAFPGETFVGEVEQVRLNAVMTQNVVVYTVVIAVDNSHGRFLPYLTANVKFQVEQRSNVLMVPNAALRWEPELSYVLPSAREDYLRGSRGSGITLLRTGSNQNRSNQTARTVWVEDGRYVRPIEVRVGVTDNVRTEIESDEIQEGTAVVYGVQQLDKANGDR